MMSRRTGSTGDLPPNRSGLNTNGDSARGTGNGALLRRLCMRKVTMAKFNDRYGIPGVEISNLSRRWYNIKNDCTWRTFDDFVFFAATHGYRKGLFLRKRVEFKPHGDDNSFFFDREEEKKLQAERIALQKQGNRYCRGCKEKCPGSGIGCSAWKKWFIENWNRNICKNPRTETNTVAFAYEHPDLVREGIVWRG